MPLVHLVTAIALVAASAVPSTTDDRTAVTYRPPVDAPLVDPFRPPATAYGAGNRGVDYATADGQNVGAAAPGEVVFAGGVGGSLHVVVLHADGLRTSYSFLAAITPGVRRGAWVAAGDPVGVAAASGLHFGVRAGDAYLDPLVLFGQRPAAARARLVPDPDERRPLAESVERRRLLDSLRGYAGAALGAGAGWARQQAAATIGAKVDLVRVLVDAAIDRSVPLPVYLALAALRWEDEQSRCTPSATPATRPQGRRIAVLVGGLGSSSGHSAVLDVDTNSLGYAVTDVSQFSYADRADAPYAAADTLGDINVSGRRLAERIADLQRRNPGVPVDVLAHSQGGLVARSAITTHGAAPATVVTMATPHQGTELASAAVGIDGSTTGHLLLRAAAEVAEARGHGIDPTGTSVAQMSETSGFVTGLPEHGWSSVTRVVSIAARGDNVVPSHQSRFGDGDPPVANVTVSPFGEGRSDGHGRLPGSPEATAEIARALAGQWPTCRSLTDTLVDEALSRSASQSQDALGAALTVAGLYADAKLRQPFRPGH